MHLTDNSFRGNKGKLQLFAYLSFMFVILIDPTNQIFHIKDIAFFGFIVVSVLMGRFSLPRLPLRYFAVLLTLAFISLFTGMMIFGTDIMCGIPYFRALLVIISFVPLSTIKIDVLLKYNYYCSFILSVVITVLFGAITLGYIDFQSFYEQSLENTTVIIASRQTLGITVPMFYYKTMPFCFLGLVYALRHRFIIPVITQFAAIILAGSRTPLLLALALVSYIIYEKYKKYFKYLIVIFCFGGVLYLLSLMLSAEHRSEGDVLKYQTASELINYSSFFGHGVGAPYWSSSLGEMITSSEVTYFEMIYQYGWLLYPFVLYIFFSPFFRLFKKKNAIDVRDFSVAYLAYLINAGTNPLLINSTGMYVFALCLVVLSKCRKDVSKNQLKYQTI